MNTAVSAISRFVDRRQAFFFPAPAVAVLFLIIVLPIAFNLYLTFTKWTVGLGQPQFIGFDNFVEAFGDERVWNGVRVMVYFSGASLALELALGLAIALYFNRAFRGSEAVQAIYIIPFAATPVAVALIWRIMLNPEIGVINYLLTSIGLPPGLWVSSEHMVVPTLVMVDVWKWTPMITLIVLAGLKSLPQDPYEAARIDGASALQIFWYITLPLIRPAIVIVVIMRMMVALSAFAAIFAATGGGPGTATEILNLYAYRSSFTELNFGYGAAQAMVLLAITLLVSLLMYRLRKSR